MGEWGYVILFFVCAWILQIIFTMVQNRHFSQTVRDLSHKHSPGYLGIGVTKQRLGTGSVVILVSDLSGTIVEAKEMTGVTVFSRFRTVPAFIGQDVESLAEISETSQRAKAIKMAAEKIIKEREKKKTQSDDVSSTLVHQA